MAGSYYYDLVGGGATTQLSLSPIVIPSVSGKNTWSPSTSNVQKPYYQIYSAMKTGYQVTSTDGTPTNLTTMAWCANAAYFYLQEMQNMTLGAGTGHDPYLLPKSCFASLVSRSKLH